MLYQSKVLEVSYVYFDRLSRAASSADRADPETQVRSLVRASSSSEMLSAHDRVTRTNVNWMTTVKTADRTKEIRTFSVADDDENKDT